MSYDLLVLAILIFAVIRGAMKGFVWQLAVIGALVLCFAFAGTSSLVMAPLIPLEPPLNRWIAMLIVYLALSFVAFGAARVLSSWIEKLKFQEYDRHLGALFGLIKGVTFALMLTFFVVTISEQQREQILRSYSGHAAALIMDRLHPVMPHELHDVLEPYIHQLDRPGLDLKHWHSDHAHSDDAERPPDQQVEESTTENNTNFFNSLVEDLKNEPGEGPGILRELLLEALENTAANDRAELMQRLRTAEPQAIHSIAAAWQNGRPENHGDPQPFGGGVAATKPAQLLSEIVAVFSDFSDPQTAIIEEIQTALSGVPNRVSTAVIRDWHADLLEIRPDPDSETDVRTTLDARILRQLSRTGVPLSTLSSRLQNRLRDSMRN